MAEAPRVAQLRDEFFPFDVQVIGVTSADREDAQEFVDGGANYPVLWDAGDDRDAWGVDFIWGSVHYLIDPAGQIVEEGLDRVESRLRTEFDVPAPKAP